jgi:hypothetical protein
VFVFDSRVQAAGEYVKSQIGRMLSVLSDTVKPDASRLGSLIRQVE